MAHKMKGFPTMANTKSHGTNANYMKSGMTNADGSPGGPPFLGGLFKGVKKAVGFGAKSGMFGPLGAMASKWMQKRKAKKDATAVANATTTQVPDMVNNIDPSQQSAVVPGTNVNAGPAVDPNAQQMVDPNQPI